MKLEEANKIICEYMGWRLYYDGFKDQKGNARYGLNALVPVWEKLVKDFGMYHFDVGVLGKSISVDITFEPEVDDDTEDYKTRIISCCEWSESIQEAAAIATAKAIRELNTMSELKRN